MMAPLSRRPLDGLVGGPGAQIELLWTVVVWRLVRLSRWMAGAAMIAGLFVDGMGVPCAIASIICSHIEGTETRNATDSLEGIETQHWNVGN